MGDMMACTSMVFEAQMGTRYMASEAACCWCLFAPALRLKRARRASSDSAPYALKTCLQRSTRPAHGGAKLNQCNEHRGSDYNQFRGSFLPWSGTLALPGGC
eukprot:jgi/Ulvmu1/4052/UM019_0029.1